VWKIECRLGWWHFFNQFLNAGIRLNEMKWSVGCENRFYERVTGKRGHVNYQRNWNFRELFELYPFNCFVWTSPESVHSPFEGIPVDIPFGWGTTKRTSTPGKSKRLHSS
jgi:hypothetical protein